jgi:TRAP-type C4-dicarboxylate transport system permease small subunit
MLQVLTRFVLHMPMIWSEEVARFLFFWVALLGAAMSVKKRRHFVIDVTTRGMLRGRKGRLLFDVVPDLCVVVFSLFLAVQGSAYAREGALRVATNSHISMTLVYAAIPVFAALSVAYGATNLLQNLHALIQGRSAEPRKQVTAE